MSVWGKSEKVYKVTNEQIEQAQQQAKAAELYANPPWPFCECENKAKGVAVGQAGVYVFVCEKHAVEGDYSFLFALVPIPMPKKEGAA
jgi:hypothetical protein